MLHFLLAAVATATAVTETYCYDNCSGHGQCVDYVCRCDLGWFGENCATSYGSIAPLSVGSMNVTTVEQVNEVCSEHRFCLVGFSSAQCTANCYKQEEEYFNTDFHGIPFLRVDAIKDKAMLEALVDSPPEIPFVLVIWGFNRRRGVFTGKQTRESLSIYALSKSRANSLVLDWHDLTAPPPFSGENIVIGYFRDVDEQEDREDFIEVAMQFQFRNDVQFYQVTKFPRKRKTRGATWFPPLSVSLPAIGTLTSQGEYKFASLTDNLNLVKFIQLSLVNSNNNVQALKLTTQSFLLAEQTKLPMLLLFAPSRQAVSALLPAFHSAASEFRDQMVFLYDDEYQFASQMHVLGLGGKENNKPVMAINSRNGAVPFNPMLDISSLDIRRFCIDYLAGRAQPLSTQQQQVVSTNSKGDDELVMGVRETLRDIEVGITQVSNTDAWATIALDESKDVLVFVYRTLGCVDCQHMTPYFKKIAARFHAMRTSHHVVCAALDLDRYRPKEFIGHMSIPSLVLLPAHSKLPPFAQYSAVIRVFPIMEWVRMNAGRQFIWAEDLPQFHDDEKEMFKIQIKQREQDRRIEL